MKTPSVVGTALLIPPLGVCSIPLHTCGSSCKPPSYQDDHYVACLFTSNGYGKTVDPSETILTNTKAAIDNLASQIDSLRVEKPEIRLGQCRAVRINSGKFGVPWARTKKVLEEGSLDMVVVRPESEEHGEEGAGKRTWRGSKKNGNVSSKSKEHGKVGKPIEANEWDESQTSGNQADSFDERMPAKRRKTRKP